ncbi:hypothetical protein Tco_1076798, partial [Tanacetum coccineum]
MSFKPLGFGWGTAGLATCSHLVVAQPSSAFAPFVVVHLVVFLGDHLVSVAVVVAVLVGTPVGWPHTGTLIRGVEAGWYISQWFTSWIGIWRRHCWYDCEPLVLEKSSSMIVLLVVDDDGGERG